MYLIFAPGRVWRGTAFGGFKGRSDLPGLVAQCMKTSQEDLIYLVYLQT